jgi:uncharacterized protein (DUF58 family)
LQAIATEAALQAAETWSLAWVPSPPRGRSGDHLGRGTGSSVEFQDRRNYQVGDDVRHLDWRAYARTGELMIKLYREELLPRVDLLLDSSCSMAVGEDKPQLAIDLATFLAFSARRHGFEVKVIELGDEPRRLDLDGLTSSGVEFSGRLPLATTLEGGVALVRPGTLRILISDFLCPHDSATLVRSLAARAGGLALFQVLSEQDVDPEIGSALRLEDAETGVEREIVLDPATVEEYLSRLERLTDALALEGRRAAARFQRIVAGRSIEEICRDDLAQAGLVVPG